DLADRLDDDTKAKDVGKLLEADGLPLHLPPDRIGALAAAGDDRRRAGLRELAGELLLDPSNQMTVTVGKLVQPLADELVGFRIELPECQILQLLAQAVHAHAAGERRVDVERLLGNPR